MRGVYFLANDKVYDLAIAFLNSFRKHNDFPLCLIPYNDNFDEIAALEKEFEFSVFDDNRVLKSCDEISRNFHGVTLGAYRKLSIWEGVFDEFIYIDVDTVVLDDVSFAFDGLRSYDVLVSHSNILENIKWVWKDSIYEADILSAKQIEFSASTGFLVSKKQSISLSEIDPYVNSAVKIKEHMELLCMEQPFLNYIFVTSGKKINSIRSLFLENNFKNAKFEAWAGCPDGTVKEGKITFSNGLPVFLLHWAGFKSLEEFPYRDLWLAYRNMNENIKPLAFGES